jgi:hypothetical protein
MRLKEIQSSRNSSKASMTQPDRWTKTNPSPGNQSEGHRPQDISKKNPSQDSDSQHGQE